MKTPAAFINRSPDNRIFTAFDPQTITRLRETLDLPDQVILSSELEQYRERLAKTEYLFSTWGMPVLDEATIREYLPALKAVFYAAGSVQEFARPYLNCGVKVFSAWAANAVPVAEFTVAEIVLSGKGYFLGMRRQQTGGREAFLRLSESLPCNYQVKVGLLGAGMIGSMVAERLRQYDFEVLVYDPFASDEKLEKLGAKRAELDEIFSECQIISNHIANLPATQRMLSYRQFSKMKPNGIFINTGRGAQVVEEDLIRALRDCPDRTALLDVTWPEPPEVDSPLLRMENVILTPHIAGSMNQEIARMGRYMADEYRAFAGGKECKYQVTLKMLETMA